MLTVSQTNDGDFSSIQSALTALAADPALERKVYIKNGIYKELLEIRIPDLVLIGEDAAHTVVSGGLYANMVLPDDTKRGTFRTYTILVNSNHVTLKNLTIENTAGDGRKVGQAIALYVGGDRFTAQNCRLLGHQDTLFTGPLPETVKDQVAAFTEPEVLSPNQLCRQYYKDCYIEGDVDFIFGGACAYFENCEIHSLDRGEDINGYTTAASTPKGQTYGYVFSHCRFTGDCAPGTVYLGRPWREHAKTALIACELGAHIHRQGWHDWGKEAAHTAACYAEYHCSGPGSSLSKRPDWIHQFSDQEVVHYGREEVLGYEN
ncbi:pectin methylesterase [Blautia liquoris]|uniref:Pectinesterase n=1 Tax=Blautia liquoris TaxID=2779518 RepID=A0A7M2RII9_9FIRM|nr:pectinesterase family protein [Blautia liquoris]QOV20146.1 pectin methylesterase [Blautia liquoris]